MPTTSNHLEALAYSEAEEAFSGDGGMARQSAPLIEVLGLIHDDVFVLREMVRSLLVMHDPTYFSDDPADHLGEYRDAPECPIHHVSLVIRKATSGGEFWGCPKWPKCSVTRRIGDQAVMQPVVGDNNPDPEDIPGEVNQF